MKFVFGSRTSAPRSLKSDGLPWIRIEEPVQGVKAMLKVRRPLEDSFVNALQALHGKKTLSTKVELQQLKCVYLNV